MVHFPMPTTRYAKEPGSAACTRLMRSGRNGRPVTTSPGALPTDVRVIQPAYIVARKFYKGIKYSFEMTDMKYFTFGIET
jgi:hypothetical protein